MNDTNEEVIVATRNLLIIKNLPCFVSFLIRLYLLNKEHNYAFLNYFVVVNLTI